MRSPRLSRRLPDPTRSAARPVRLRRSAGLLLAACLAAALPAPVAAAPYAPLVSRGGYSRKLAPQVDGADLRNTLAVYSRLISDANKLVADPSQPVYDSAADMARSLRAGEVDVIVGPAEEVLAVPSPLSEPPVLVTANHDQPGVEYVLLVHVDGPVRALADLARARLNFVESPTSSLAPVWLDDLLASQGLPPTSRCREVRRCPKPTLAALPVYFHQADACVLPRATFEVLCELNPALHRALRPIAQSPKLFPLVAIFRQAVPPKLKASILNAVATLPTNAPGRQLLTLLQVDRVEPCAEPAMAATRQLLARHASRQPPAGGPGLVLTAPRGTTAAPLARLSPAPTPSVP